MPFTSLSLAQIGLYSMGSKRTPPNTYMHHVIDVSQWRDPQGNKNLRRRFYNGLAEEIWSYVAQDPKWPALRDSIRLTAAEQIESQNVPWLTFGFRDHHGVWIAPAVAELVAEELSQKYRVFVKHYELG